jgi:hypothetical protein
MAYVDVCEEHQDPSGWENKDQSYLGTFARIVLPPRTTGSILVFPAMLFLSTTLRALCSLMYGRKHPPLPGLRATSQNILWPTMKVNEACARPPHVM